MNVTTSANGSICLYVYGTADLIVDIAGYYIDHNHDDRYYTETEVDTALTSKADITSLMAPITPSLPVTIDSTGSVGFYSAITIGIDGNPVISYHDDTNGDLKVAACNNPTCTTSTNSTIDSVGLVGIETSIAIGTNGNPIISYRDGLNNDLKIAACNNPTCTTSTNTTIDSAGVVGTDSSITIGTSVAEGFATIWVDDEGPGVCPLLQRGRAVCPVGPKRACKRNEPGRNKAEDAVPQPSCIAQG
jgi:hypothetical protein